MAVRVRVPGGPDRQYSGVTPTKPKKGSKHDDTDTMSRDTRMDGSASGHPYEYSYKYGQLKSKSYSSFWNIIVKSITIAMILIALSICYLSQLDAADQQRCILEIKAKLQHLQQRSTSVWNAATDTSSSTANQVALGTWLLKNNDPAGAESMCKLAAEQSPLDVKAWTCLGEARLALHNSAWVSGLINMEHPNQQQHRLVVDKLHAARDNFETAANMNQGATCVRARLGLGLSLFLTATRRSPDGIQVQVQAGGGGGGETVSQLLFDSILHLNAAASLTSPSVPLGKDESHGEREKIHMVAIYNTALAHLALGDSSSAMPLLRQMTSFVNDNGSKGFIVPEVNLAATLVQKGYRNKAIYMLLNATASEFCGDDRTYEYASDKKETKSKKLCAIVQNNLAVVEEANGNEVDYESAVLFEQELRVQNGFASINLEQSGQLKDAEAEEELLFNSTENVVTANAQLSVRGHDASSTVYEALMVLEEAAAKDSNQGRLWISLSKARFRSGDRIGAVEAGTKALNAATTLDEIEAANDVLDAALTQHSLESTTTTTHLAPMVNDGFGGDTTDVRALRLEQEVLSLKFQLLQQSLLIANGFIREQSTTDGTTKAQSKERANTIEENRVIPEAAESYERENEEPSKLSAKGTTGQVNVDVEEENDVQVTASMIESIQQEHEMDHEEIQEEDEDDVVVAIGIDGDAEEVTEESTGSHASTSIESDTVDADVIDHNKEEEVTEEANGSNISTPIEIHAVDGDVIDHDKEEEVTEDSNISTPIESHAVDADVIDHDTEEEVTEESDGSNISTPIESHAVDADVIYHVTEEEATEESDGSNISTPIESHAVDADVIDLDKEEEVTEESDGSNALTPIESHAEDDDVIDLDKEDDADVEIVAAYVNATSDENNLEEASDVGDNVVETEGVTDEIQTPQLEEEIDSEREEEEIVLPELYNPAPVEVEEVPDAALSYMKMADAYLQKESFKLASKQFMKVLKKAPYHIPAILGYASSLERFVNPKQLGDVVMAYANVTQHALTQDTMNLAQASFRRALLVSREMEGDRIDVLQRLSAVAFTYELAADAQFELGMEMLKQSSADSQYQNDAILSFRIANGYSAKNSEDGSGFHPQSLVQLGKMAMDIDGNPKRALSLLENALTMELGDLTVEALVYSARSKEGLNDIQGALQDYQKAVAPELPTSEATVTAHYNLAVAMMHQKMNSADIENHMEMALNLGKDVTVS